MTTSDRSDSTIISARIDRGIAEEAAAVFDTMGLTVSDAVRLLLGRVAAEKRLPFDPLPPNAETIAAIEEARRGELTYVGSVEELREHLHRDGRHDTAQQRERNMRTLG